MQELETLLTTKVEQTFVLAFAGRFSEAALRQVRADFAALEVARRSVKLERVIGQGASGEVHLGQLGGGNGGGARVAVKMCHRDKAVDGVPALSDTAAEEGLQLEARLLHQLQHPHIVRVAALVTRSLPTWVCLEYLANGDLKSYLRCGACAGVIVLFSCIVAGRAGRRCARRSRR
jgi:hypothetical protein